MVRKCRFVAALVCILVVGGPAASASDSLPKHHALSLIGKPKYAPDFKHFAWANPDAPKGGRVRQWSLGNFDSLNPFPIKGHPADGVPLIYDTLMAKSPDEASTSYGLVAEWVTYPDDYSSATMRLRSNARFHDGKPITADDVIFSMDQIKKVSPGQAFYYKNVVRVEKRGDHEVTFVFDVKGNRELPVIVGDLPVLPKHFYEGVGANGEPRDLAKSTLEIPLGSGPYRIKEVDPGRSITYERVKDWWAKDLPVSKGQWNFDEIKYTYFRDRVPAFEAFKAGNLDFWRENSAKNWATAFDFEAVKRGLVKWRRCTSPRWPTCRRFAFNIRRPQFQDARVRRAFNLAFDFEWANKNLFYDQYQRVGSYFDNSELKSPPGPQAASWRCCSRSRTQVPPELFTTEWRNPVNATPEDARRHLGAGGQAAGRGGLECPRRRAHQCAGRRSCRPNSCSCSRTSSASCCRSRRRWRSSA